MKFEIPTKQFALAARIVSIIATREAFPTESAHVYMRAKGEEIRFAATDRECRVELKLEGVPVSEAGEITFYVPTLKALCSRLVGDSVLVNHDQNSPTIVSFRSGQFKGTMNLIACQALKNIQIPSCENPIECQSTDLSDALSQVCFAAASEKSASERFLSDVRIIGKEHYLEFVACDRYRLAMKKLVLSPKKPVSLDMSVPVRSLNKLRTLLREISEERILLGATESEFVISGRGWGMTCMLSTLPYPALFRQMIPSETKTTAIVGREEFLDALRRSSCLGLMDETFPRTITILFEKEQLRLEAQNEVGRGSENVKAKIEGPSLQVSISANHMEDGLEVLSCDRVKLQANGPRDQVLLTPDLRELHFKYVVMPKT